MTLIAAWRCANGIVIHADSQETVPVPVGTEWVDYRKAVQKIRPKRMGPFNVVAGGSGNGRLIESFIIRLERTLSAASDAANLADFVTLFESELARFYELDIALAEDKSMTFVVGAYCTLTGEYDAWVTEHLTLRRISDDGPELVGWDEALYDTVADRLYTRGMSIHQAVLSGIYLLTIAESTSNYVKGPFSVAVIRDNGIWMEPDDYIKLVQNRLEEYEQWINRVFLACADTSIFVSDLESFLSEFSRAAVDLHRQHIDGMITWERVLSTNDSYPRFPHPSIITAMGNGALRFEHDPEKLKQTMERFESIRKTIPNIPRAVTCLNCSCELEYYLAVPEEIGEPGVIRCPTCGAACKTAGKVLRFRKIATGEPWTQV